MMAKRCVPFAALMVMAAVGCGDDDPVRLRNAEDDECDGRGGSVFSQGNQVFYSCNGEDGEDGAPGAPGAPGADGGSAPSLGELQGFVLCQKSAQSDIGAPYTHLAKTWFFSSGWTFTRASLGTSDDDESQSDFNQPGQNPVFTFDGLPVLFGNLTYEMDLELEQLRINQNANLLETLDWDGEECADSRAEAR